MAKLKEKQYMIKIHNKISFALFSNLMKYIRIKTLADDLQLNWRTIKSHLNIMSSDYKTRKKAEKELIKLYEEV